MHARVTSRVRIDRQSKRGPLTEASRVVAKTDDDPEKNADVCLLPRCVNFHCLEGLIAVTAAALDEDKI